jgi:hypothetical protein
MEVRPGQHAATIAQALAHNLSTVDRDFDMFRKLLEARGDTETLSTIEVAQRLTHRAYANMLEVFGEEVAAVEADPEGHLHTHDHGTERSFVAEAAHDAERARRFETR